MNEQKAKKEGKLKTFLKKIGEKIDKKMEEKAKNSTGGCCGMDNKSESKGSSCCD